MGLWADNNTALQSTFQLWLTYLEKTKISVILLHTGAPEIPECQKET